MHNPDRRSAVSIYIKIKSQFLYKMATLTRADAASSKKRVQPEPPSKTSLEKQLEADLFGENDSDTDSTTTTTERPKKRRKKMDEFEVTSSKNSSFDEDLGIIIDRKGLNFSNSQEKNSEFEDEHILSIRKRKKTEEISENNEQQQVWFDEDDEDLKVELSSDRNLWKLRQEDMTDETLTGLSS